MTWTLICIAVLSVVAVIINIIGIYLLLRLRNRQVNQQQKILLVVLCSLDLLFGFVVIIRCFSQIFRFPAVIRDCFVFFQQLTLASVYMYVMFLITIDRYLALKMNIKYSVYCTPNKIKNSIYFSVLIFTTLYGICFTISFFHPQDIVTLTITYLYPIYEFSFIVTVVITYYLVFKKFKELHRQTQRIKLQLRQNNWNHHDKFITKVRFNLYLPTAIIVTFAIFTILPNMIFRITLFFNVFPSLYLYSKILYPIGWCCDSFVYICSILYNKRRIAKTLKVHENSLTTKQELPRH